MHQDISIHCHATAWLAESDCAPTIHRQCDLGGILAPLPDLSADPMVVVASSPLAVGSRLPVPTAG